MLNAPWNPFYADLPFVTFWKLICSHAVTPRWLDDAKECIQSAWSKQRDCCSIGLLVTLKEAFLKNYLAILAEQKRYLSVWLRASNERYFSFNWRLVIIKHDKLFAAKFRSEMNARFINYSQLLLPRPLITHWNWKLICSSVHVFCSTSEPSWMKECFEFCLGKHWIWIVGQSTSVSIIFKTITIQSSRLVNANV